jgi:hypothetical protein
VTTQLAVFKGHTQQSVPWTRSPWGSSKILTPFSCLNCCRGCCLSLRSSVHCAQLLYTARSSQRFQILQIRFGLDSIDIRQFRFEQRDSLRLLLRMMPAALTSIILSHMLVVSAMAVPCQDSLPDCERLKGSDGCDAFLSNAQSIRSACQQTCGMCSAPTTGGSTSYKVQPLMTLPAVSVRHCAASTSLGWVSQILLCCVTRTVLRHPHCVVPRSPRAIHTSCQGQCSISRIDDHLCRQRL